MLEHQNEALAASGESVLIYRLLVESGHEQMLPGLANALHTRAAVLADLGRWNEVLVVSEECISIYRRLIEGGRDDLLPDLATALDNWGNALGWGSQR